MDYTSANELAAKWNITGRRITVLCNQGRITGAMKINGRWFVPIDAKKPADLRKFRHYTEFGTSQKQIDAGAIRFISANQLNKDTSQEDLRVSDLFTFGYFQDWKLVGGSNGAKHPITSLNMMESPDVANWVKEGQFIISTGYCIRDDINVQKQIILDLSKAGCAGLAIKIMRFFRTIPQHMIDLAEEYDLPLIEIPDNYNISEVMNNITKKVYAKRLEELELSHRLFNTFTEAAFNGNKTEVTSQLGILLRSSVSVIQLNWCQFSSFAFPGGGLSQEEMTLAEAQIDLPMLVSAGPPAVQRATLKGGCVFYCHIFQIELHDELMGYISIWNDREEITNNERIAIQNASKMIALLLRRIQQDNDNLYSQKETFLMDELSNRLQSEKIALRRAASIGLDISYKYRSIILKKDPQSIDEANGFQGKDMEYLKEVIRMNYTNTNLVQIDNCLVLIFAEKSGKSTEAVGEFIAFIKSELKYLKGKLLFAVGQCGPISRLHISYKQAEEAIQLYKMSKKEPIDDVIYYEKIKVPSFLITMDDDKRHYLYTKVLQKLEQYDAEHGADLLQTIRAYFQYHENVSLTARELFIHRNTLLFRLQKIEDLLDMSLDNRDDTFMINMALRLQPYKE